MQKQNEVNATALISLTQFLNRAQVNNQSSYNYYPVHAFGRLADRDAKIVPRDVIPYLKEQLKQAVKQEQSQKIQVLIRSLGNLGHPDILGVFEPLLEGKTQVSDFQRLAIVVALDKLVINHPKLARSVLMKIYQNQGDVHEIRCAAVFQIFRTNPQAATLQRMAEETHREPSKHVRAAVRSAIESAAQLDQGRNAELANAAKAAVNLLNREEQGAQYSRTHLRDYVIRELDAAYEQQASFIGSQDHFFPSALFVHNQKDLAGFRRHSEYYAMVSSIDQLTNVFDDQFDDSKLYQKDNNNRSGNNKRHNNKNQQHQSKNQPDTSKWSVDKIAQLLNIQVDEAEQLEGQILATVMNTKRFFAFDNETLNEIPRKVRHVAAALQNGHDFNYTKLYNEDQYTISFPLQTGFPFIFSLKRPTLVQSGGRVQLRSSPNMAEGNDNEVRIPKSINITAEVEMVYSTNVDARVGFITPHNHQRYTAGYNKKAQIYLPLRVRADIDLRNNEVESEIRPLHPKKDVKILHASSWPYTAREDILALRPVAENKETKAIHTRPARQFDEDIGDKATGLNFNVRGKHEKEFYDFAEFYQKLQQNDLTSAWMFTQAASSPEHYNFNVEFQPERSSTNVIKIAVNYDYENGDDDDQTNQPTSQEQKHPRARFNAAAAQQKNKNLAIPESTSANSERRRLQFLHSAGVEIDRSQNTVVDLSIVFDGKYKAEYVATIATATSLVDQKSRVLAFVAANPARPTEKFNNVEVCFQGEAKFANAPELNFKNALNNDATSSAQFELVYGDKCNSKSANKIQGKAKMQQTEELKDRIRNDPMAKLCAEQMDQGNNLLPACQNLTDRANTLNRFDATIEFDKITEHFKNQTNKWANWARQWAYPYLSEDITHNGQKNKIQIQALLNNNMRYANLTIETPENLVQLRQVRLQPWAQTILTVNPNLNMWERVQRDTLRYENTCAIDENKLNTFDNRTINHEFGKCWHVVLHTAEPEDNNSSPSSDSSSAGPNNNNQYENSDEQLSILVRDAESQEQKNNNRRNPQKAKEVLIVLGQADREDIVIRLSPQAANAKTNTPRMHINDEEKFPTQKHIVVIRTDDDAQQPLIRAYAMPKGELKVQVRDGQLDITYDGERMKVRANSQFRNNVRGVCGTFTGEKESDMKSPQNCVLRRESQFVASWAVADQNCQGPAKERQRELQSATCLKEKVLYGNVISESQAGRKPVRRAGDSSSSSR